MSTNSDSLMAIKYNTTNYKSMGCSKTFSKHLLNCISKCKKDYDRIVVFNIGTPKTLFDSVAQRLGTLLKEENLENITVYGDMDKPNHAMNLQDNIEKYIKPTDLVIAIDPCLTNKESRIGDIDTYNGVIKPGSGAGKDLGTVGDVSVHICVDLFYVGYFKAYYEPTLNEKEIDKIAKILSKGIKIADKKISTEMLKNLCSNDKDYNEECTNYGVM